MARSTEVTARDDVIDSFSNCNMERFYETFIKIIERKENVKITYEFRKKTPEELAIRKEKENYINV